MAHYIPLHGAGAPLTSTEGSLTAASCSSAPAGSPPAITTTGPKLPFFPGKNTRACSRHQCLSFHSPSQSPVWSKGAMAHGNTPLQLFKRMGQANGLWFSFSVGFLRVEP